MNDPRFIRSSDRRAPEEYPEWLQMDADRHAPGRWRRSAVRLAYAGACLLLAVALIGSLAAWRDHLASADTGIWHRAPKP